MVRIKGMAVIFIVTVEDVSGVDQEEVDTDDMQLALEQAMHRIQTLHGRDEGDVTIRVRVA